MTTRVFTLICLCALLACALQGALTGVAQAEVPKLVSNGQFASEGGGLGVAVDNSCSLHTPPLSGSACTEFDPSANDVFVAGFVGPSTLGRIQKFDASDNLLSPPSPFGEILNYGAAVNPTNGDLYVARALSDEIATYDPNTGALISSFSVPPFFGAGGYEPYENTTQIAADAEGNVYVPNVPGNEVLKYSPTGTLLETFTGSGAHPLKRPNGVTIDSSGNLWVADSGNNRIVELSPAGAPVEVDGKPVEIKSEGVRSLALYEHEGALNVLAIVNNSADPCGTLKPPCGHLVEYSSSGVQLADVGAGEIGSTSFNASVAVSLVAVDEASGRAYVTDALKDRVLVFQPPVAPVLGRESAAEVSTSEAKLGALVSPGGAQATYRFEYLTEAAFQADKESFSGPEEPASVPFPEGSAGEGFSPRTVWASTKDLTPGTTYYYRAVVTNGVGKPVVGPQETFTTATLAQAACPNEDARGGFSAVLPDCRAYELVTPTGKTSAQPDTGDFEGGVRARAGADGKWVAFPAVEVMPGSQSAGLEFIAARGASGWSIEDALPLQSYTGDRCTTKDNSVVKAYSAELTKEVVLVNNNNGSVHESSDCHGAAVEIVPGEPLEEENLLLRDNENATYRLINLTPPGVVPTPPSLVAESADLNVVLFSERAKLTPEAQNNTENLYEWREGTVHLFKYVLPSGAPVAGSLVGFSEDGSEMFFTANGKLYVSLNDGERTVQIDEAQQGGSGPGGGGSFAAVTANESQAFFTDNATAGLTSDTVPGSGTNLYVYDIGTGRLSDLTPFSDANATFKGIGQDGSYLYFDSPAVLTAAAANQFGEKAEQGQENLYVDHEGTLTFVMHGGGGAMSANGAFFTFASYASLTGYEHSGVLEVYMYSAEANRFQCATCNPSGEAPTAGGVGGGSVSNNGQVFFQTPEALLPGDTNGQVNVYEFDWGSGLHLISTGTSLSESILLASTPSGNDVFFLSRQTLVPQDNPQEGNVIYDARADGGFPEPAQPPACTTPEACRAAPEPEPSIYGAPPSQTFAGIGNLAPASEAKPKAKAKSKPVKCKKKGFVKKKGKCVKKPKKKAKKSAHANRTGK